MTPAIFMPPAVFIIGVPFEDENDFQWLGIGFVLALLVLALIALVRLYRRGRKQNKRLDAWEDWIRAQEEEQNRWKNQ